ncbi:MAG TPA: XRE family transcriptional regulator [Tissierellaceae bacterium]|jgi:transcriptional regulator with XRE-family HTH domain|nr:XRE family transcriptional regulator [Tissierellaceae bacterium]
MNFGEKIKAIRVKKNLTQEELADRCELTKGFISQVERDLTSPSIATLVDILEGLGTNLKDFFNEEEEEKIVFRKEDVFETVNEDLKYVLHWIIPNAQKNAMEPIMVTLSQGGRTKEDSPHEGEEFGYVLSGTIYLHLGNEKYKVRKGESFYYRTNSDHYIENAGKSEASLIWVSTPPNF